MWWRTSRDLTRLQFEVSYPFDASFEQAAYIEAARFEARPVEKMRAYFIPITMTFNSEKCVELRPRKGVYGGHSIFCFDIKSGRLLRKEQVGQ
jgi:hypothetical protein